MSILTARATGHMTLEIKVYHRERRATEMELLGNIRKIKSFGGKVIQMNLLRASALSVLKIFFAMSYALARATYESNFYQPHPIPERLVLCALHQGHYQAH